MALKHWFSEWDPHTSGINMWELVGFTKFGAHGRYPKPETPGLHANFDGHFSRIIVILQNILHRILFYL